MGHGRLCRHEKNSAPRTTSARDAKPIGRPICIAVEEVELSVAVRTGVVVDEGSIVVETEGLMIELGQVSKANA
jgi:hypothetical protein